MLFFSKRGAINAASFILFLFGFHAHSEGWSYQNGALVNGNYALFDCRQDCNASQEANRHGAVNGLQFGATPTKVVVPECGGREVCYYPKGAAGCNLLTVDQWNSHGGNIYQAREASSDGGYHSDVGYASFASWCAARSNQPCRNFGACITDTELEQFSSCNEQAIVNALQAQNPNPMYFPQAAPDQVHQGGN